MPHSREWAYAPRPWAAGSVRMSELLSVSLEFLDRLGVRVPASGRHQRALDCLRRANILAADGHPLPTHLRTDLQHAHRTAWETSVIMVAASRAIDQLRGRHRDLQPFTQDALQTMMRGPFAYAHRSDPGWNSQFELLVASQLVLGGLAVKSGEPDLLFKYGHEWTGVACKRVSSLENPQLLKNVKDAANQIERTGRRGWIALNLESALRDLSVRGRRQALLRRFSTAFGSLDPIAARVSGRPGILGVIGYAHLSEWNQRPGCKPTLAIRAPFRWLCWEGENAAAAMFFTDFQQAWRPRVRQSIKEIMMGDISRVV